MIGGGGSYSLFHFTNATQDAGVIDSYAYGGSGFYSRRVSARGQYIGLRYAYSRSTTDTYSTTTGNQNSSLFYSTELGHAFSLSLSGGADYVTINSPGYLTSNTWAPSGTASFGWHGRQTNVSASYARAVSQGWGFVGAYKSDTLGLSLGRELGRRLTGNISGNYADVQNLAALPTSATEAGHTIFGRASLAYGLTEHMALAADYGRVHQNYAESGSSQSIQMPIEFHFSRLSVQEASRKMTTTEQIEEQSGQPDLQRYLDIIRRRYLFLLIPFFLGWLAVWGASWILQPKYKSTTQILIEEPTMPENYVEPNVNWSLQDRLASMSQQILSRTRLKTIIDKLHLYGGDADSASENARIARMT